MKGEKVDPHVKWTMEDYKRAIKEAADSWYASTFNTDNENNDRPDQEQGSE